MALRIVEVRWAIMLQNHQQDVDAARLLHMPSDSLDMNLVYGELEKKRKLEIVRAQG